MFFYLNFFYFRQSKFLQSLTTARRFSIEHVYDKCVIFKHDVCRIGQHVAVTA